MPKFDFRGSRIGRQFIHAGDVVFDQRGQTVGSQQNIGEPDLTSELTTEHLEVIDAVALRFEWTRARALRQIVEDWAQTFDWQRG